MAEPATDDGRGAAAAAPPPPEAGFRGRCLYKTGKCANERALKTSGAPHNLCEEHRSRQNQHQRKLDAKNRVARKDKRPAKKLRGDAGELGALVDGGGGGVVFLPHGAQPPPLAALPLAIQDFDGIVVPIPSYVEPHERADFRARVYQKVLDYISEECVLRFSGGGGGGGGGARGPEPEPRPKPKPKPASSSGTASEPDDDEQQAAE